MHALKKSIASITIEKLFVLLLTAGIISFFMFSCSKEYTNLQSTEYPKDTSVEENMTKTITQPFIYPELVLPFWKAEGEYRTGHGTQTHYKAVPEEFFLQYEKSLEDCGFPVLQKETLTGKSESGAACNNYFDYL